MKSTIWKVLAVVMAAAAIACVGTGCAKSDTKDSSSSSSSASSAASSKDESKTESSAESKAESSEASKTESAAEESKTESAAEESKTESEASAEESKEESEAASQEESTVTLGNEVFCGSWEYTVGGNYTGMTINEDGSAVLIDAYGNTTAAEWTVEDGKLTVSADGSDLTFDYVDGVLKDENGKDYFPVSAISGGSEAAESVDTSMVEEYFGSWEFTAGSVYLGIMINADGSATYVNEEHLSVSGRWTIEDDKLYIRAAGGLQILEYNDGKLVDVDTGHIYDHVDALLS